VKNQFRTRISYYRIPINITAAGDSDIRRNDSSLFFVGIIPKLNWFSDFTNNFSLFKRDTSEFLLNQNPKTNLFLVYKKEKSPVIPAFVGMTAVFSILCTTENGKNSGHSIEH